MRQNHIVILLKPSTPLLPLLGGGTDNIVFATTRKDNPYCNYLTFTVEEETAYFYIEFSYPTGTTQTPPVFEYSTDGGKTWKNVAYEEIPDSDGWNYVVSFIAFGKETPLYLRGNNPQGLTEATESWGSAVYTRSTEFNVFDSIENKGGILYRCDGNIMHLLSYETELDEIPCNYCFSWLFWESCIMNTPELPATKLKDFCYYGMFFDCYYLHEATVLPATELKEGCYSCMFYECFYEWGPYYDYGYVPQNMLPATTLAYGCYDTMFYECYYLRNAPDLPAQFVPAYAYYEMFEYCYYLNYCKVLATECEDDDWDNYIYEMGYDAGEYEYDSSDPSLLTFICKAGTFHDIWYWYGDWDYFYDYGTVIEV